MPSQQTAPATESPPTTSDPSTYKPIRVWPPTLLMGGMVLARWLPSLIEDGPAMLWMSAAFGPVLCGLLIIVWWIVASRATVRERMVGALGMIVAAITWFVVPMAYSAIEERRVLRAQAETADDGTAAASETEDMES